MITYLFFLYFANVYWKIECLVKYLLCTFSFVNNLVFNDNLLLNWVSLSRWAQAICLLENWLKRVNNYQFATISIKILTV